MTDTTSSRTNKDARREEILNAAYEEFADKGYAGASMEAIARRARCSKETLYAWFDDKKSLFNTLFAARLQRIGSEVTAALSRDPSPSNVLPVIARDVIRLVLAIIPLTQAGFGAGEGGKTVTRSMGEAITATRKDFVAYLNWCRDQRFIAFDDDPFELASIFIAMAQAEWGLRLATGMVDAVTDQMIDEHAQRVTKLFLKALDPATK